HRLLTDPVLPFDYAEHARELVAALEDWQRAAGNRFDLSEPLRRARELERRAQDLRRRAGEVRRRPSPCSGPSGIWRRRSRAPMRPGCWRRVWSGPATTSTTPWPRPWTVWTGCSEERLDGFGEAAGGAGPRGGASPGIPGEAFRSAATAQRQQRAARRRGMRPDPDRPAGELRPEEQPARDRGVPHRLRRGSRGVALHRPLLRALRRPAGRRA